jgi:hypothetical protein
VEIIEQGGNNFGVNALIIYASMEGGTILFSSFTQLCKVLLNVLMIMYAISQLPPLTIDYLALIFGNTIPFIWNLLAMCYLEQ